MLRVNTRLKALDEIYKICTLLHLWNSIWKPRKALLASVLRTKHTAPEEKPSDRSAPHSKIRLNFVKHFRMFAVLFSNFCSFFANWIQQFWSTFFGISAIKFCTETIWNYQNLLDWKVDSQISWDFATNILKFSENDFRKIRKKLKVEKNPF